LASSVVFCAFNNLASSLAVVRSLLDIGPAFPHPFSSSSGGQRPVLRLFVVEHLEQLAAIDRLPAVGARVEMVASFSGSVPIRVPLMPFIW
jgi:hypothetical protein